MNTLDKQYLDLCKDILGNGIKKQNRTGVDTISVFGRQIRHKMSDGFPLLTTKKMYFKGIVTELLWFLRGDTNIKYLVDNDCHIWDGDAYKNYCEEVYSNGLGHREDIKEYDEIWNKETREEWPIVTPFSQEEFINKIKTDNVFAKKWGDLGPIYGKQWRSWTKFEDESVEHNEWYKSSESIDQFTKLINDLKTNPDSRRIMITAWNPSEIDNAVLPPCHYGFQVYTRELSEDERYDLCAAQKSKMTAISEEDYIKYNIPTRAISLMWNQRSVDTPLGLPFNIASYGLLLEIIAKIVNMVPDELIGNLGDTHIYANQIEGIAEQLGRDMTLEERKQWWFDNNKPNRDVCDYVDTLPILEESDWYDKSKVPTRTREPYPLPTLNINTEFWLTETGECGIGPLTGNIDLLINSMKPEDFQVINYKSHPSIKIPLSN